MALPLHGRGQTFCHAIPQQWVAIVSLLRFFKIQDSFLGLLFYTCLYLGYSDEAAHGFWSTTSDFPTSIPPFLHQHPYSHCRALENTARTSRNLWATLRGCVPQGFSMGSRGTTLILQPPAHLLIPLRELQPKSPTKKQVQTIGSLGLSQHARPKAPTPSTLRPRVTLPSKPLISTTPKPGCQTLSPDTCALHLLVRKPQSQTQNPSGERHAGYLGLARQRRQGRLTHPGEVAAAFVQPQSCFGQL